MEVGYGENDDELLNDTNLLLEGSKGNIGFVILVRIESLTSGQIESGYVELHRYSSDMEKRVMVGDRMVSFLNILVLSCVRLTVPSVYTRYRQIMQNNVSTSLGMMSYRSNWIFVRPRTARYRCALIVYGLFLIKRPDSFRGILVWETRAPST